MAHKMISDETIKKIDIMTYVENSLPNDYYSLLEILKNQENAILITMQKKFNIDYDDARYYLNIHLDR